jgi:flagellar biosynthesis chaperone FliJ
MSNLYKLTKEELIARCKKLQSENENLQDELDSLSDCYTEMENQLAERINALDAVDIIKDVDHFKYRLQLDNLLTQELESFIENYLRFYNYNAEKG